MRILGIHTSFNSKTHDPSIAVFEDGELIFAAEEERFLRYKTASGRFPEYSLKACLTYLNIKIESFDLIAIDGITSKNLKRKVVRYIEDLYGICPEIYVVHHAESHCIGASYFYGQKDALVVSCDGYGDGVSTRIYNSDEQNFELVYESNADISLGDFYTAFTNYLGFKKALRENIR